MNNYCDLLLACVVSQTNQINDGWNGDVVGDAHVQDLAASAYVTLGKDININLDRDPITNSQALSHMIAGSELYEGLIERIELHVTSNKDSEAEGTLRWAINQTQNNRGYYDIIFKTPENSKPNNQLGTGYWTIELKSPLPEITSSNIRINHSETKNIILTSKGKKNGWGNIKDANNSLMTIGDPRLLYADYLYNDNFEDIKASKNNIFTTPQVFMKNMNFTGHEVTGQSAGGGGLGAGGAIVIFDGIVDIKNSIFQNLSSTGGVGKTFGYEASGVGGNGDNNEKNFLGAYGVDVYRARDGWSGAPGGSPSFQVWSNNRHGPAWKFNDDPNKVLDQLTSRGGKGGEGFAVLNKNWVPAESNGKPGQSGKFGFGGANGGGGGAVGVYIKVQNGIVPVSYEEAVGKSSAGDGGDGGYLAGGGAGGGAGVSWEKGSNSNSGRGGDGYQSGGNGSRTSGWAGGTSGIGGAGAGVGGAIAILQKESRLGTSSIALNLDSVDFINTKSSSSLGDAVFMGGLANPGGNAVNELLGLGSNAKITFNNVKYAESHRDEPVAVVEANQKKNVVTHGITSKGSIHEVEASQFDIYDMYLDEISKHTDQQIPINKEQEDNPFHFAISSPYKDDVIKLRGTTIDLTKGSPEIVSIVYETPSSGEIGIYTDMSDKHNPFYKMWQKIVPDKSDIIQAEYEASLAADIFSMESLGEAGINLAKDLLMVNSLNNANTGEYGWGLGATTKFATFGAQMVFNHMQAEKNNAAAENKRLNDIDKNMKERNAMIEMLENNKNSQLSLIDTNFKRTAIEINNFVLGEDTLTLPFKEEYEPIVRPSGKDRVQIEASEKLEDNSPVIAYINIANMNEFSNEATARDEVEKLLNYNEILNAYQITPYNFKQNIINEIRPVIGGPTHDYFQTNHSELPQETKITIQANGGDDQLVGSTGYDILHGMSGNDIFTLGKNSIGVPADEIYGGSGIDTLIFTGDQKPFRFIAENSSCGRLNIYTLDDNLEKSPITIVDGIEAYEAFKGSYIDFSKLSMPCDSSKHSASFGAGSQFIGSNYSDNILLSFEDSVNFDGNADDRWDLASIIDGRGTNDQDRLTLNFSNHDESISLFGSQQAYQVFKRDQLIADVTNVEQLVMLGSKSNDNFIINDIKDSEYYIEAGDGDDLLDTSGSKAKHFLEGGDGSDSMIGGPGIDKFNGGKGDDILQGHDGEDTLKGAKGNDIIIGGKGSDVIDGGPGSDVYIGGSGGDFYLADLLSEGVDIIKDFNIRRDKILVKDIQNIKYEFIEWIDQEGSIMGSAIAIDGVEIIILEDIFVDQLDQSIFNDQIFG